MKKALLFLAIVLFGMSAYAGWFYWKNLRGALPAIIPPSITPRETINGLSIDSGFSMSIFVENISGPRALTFDPNGILVVSAMGEGRVIALPDADKDEVADEAIIVAEGLNRPHGIAFHCSEDNCFLYVAETDRVSVYEYDRDNLKAINKRKIIDLPSASGHFTRTILITPFQGEEKLFISVGSSCNVCREEDFRRAKVLYSDLNGENLEEFATGLRNAVFMATRPGTEEVWVTEMGRDLIGDDIPPDEINILKKGGNYGWPICYGKNIHDTFFDKNVYVRNPCVEPFEIPSHIDIQAHSAPLGLVFTPHGLGWGEEYENNLFVALHGSWNRTIPTGYKIVRYKLDESGFPSGEAKDFIAGWLRGNESSGRPVDIIFDKDNAMFISDDKAGVIYKVSRD